MASTRYRINPQQSLPKKTTGIKRKGYENRTKNGHIVGKTELIVHIHYVTNENVMQSQIFQIIFMKATIKSMT